MTAGLQKPTDLERLQNDLSYEPTLDDWNWLVHEAGAAYKRELSARTVFESELFGMNTYILAEIVWQRRGQAERRQVQRHRLGLVETMGGGAAGMDGNACVVTILSVPEED